MLIDELKMVVFVRALYVIFVYVVDFYACKSSPCKHEGRCYNMLKGFICICNAIYGGLMCDGR